MFFNYFLRIKGKQEQSCGSTSVAQSILEKRYPGRKIVVSVVAAWNVSHNIYLDEFGGELVGELVYEAGKNWFNSFDANGRPIS